jgi:hypothetical protein
MTAVEDAEGVHQAMFVKERAVEVVFEGDEERVMRLVSRLPRCRSWPGSSLVRANANSTTPPTR